MRVYSRFFAYTGARSSGPSFSVSIDPFLAVIPTHHRADGVLASMDNFGHAVDNYRQRLSVSSLCRLVVVAPVCAGAAHGATPQLPAQRAHPHQPHPLQMHHHTQVSCTHTRAHTRTHTHIHTC